MKRFSNALVVITLCIIMYLGDLGRISEHDADAWDLYGSVALVLFFALIIKDIFNKNE